MQRSTTTGTRADELYELLRSEIFLGRLEPGKRLKFPELSEAYGTSVGPVREALTKLTAERLVTLQPHLGYAVASLSAGELTELTTARVDIEGLAFGHAIQEGGDGWESEVVAAHHLLNLRDRDIAAKGRGDDWYLAHEAFHAALLAGCGNHRLIEIARGLRAETELYRRWAAPLLAENDRDPVAEHKALADAALDRDLDRGVRLLREHIAFTTQMLLSELLPLDADLTEH
ncbi:FCD domain-containing protein [Herbiconiux sp. CPCC 203407]|uniref:FCD domain-containing protein n=1 Tax=Herbiconiux oxytropis TaxID=2970915 RepID=A0AA41XFT4_9MICO|nr:FCD domain-containing protein [Herbiconiux oxytropis]MCS5720773.1 FCD domain-containing protein [Herbiconiux oxytropis]MCS5724900.1 FCD domain-containing protein [Herbiconiux oxytropis]